MTDTHDEQVETDEVPGDVQHESAERVSSENNGQDVADSPEGEGPSARSRPETASAPPETDAESKSAAESDEANEAPIESDHAAEAAPDSGDIEAGGSSDPEITREAGSDDEAAESETTSAGAERGTEDASSAAPKPAPAAPPRPERPEVTELREAQKSRREVEGQVIGWNNGGLHVVVNGVTAFCPRSEIEVGAPKALESYLDQKMTFHVLRVQKRGRRVVLSRRGILQAVLDEKIHELQTAMQKGEILEGKVSSITDFGAFVDLGGIDGLVHISEISRNRIEHASEVVSEGDTVKVRVLRIGDDGRRISLSMKALEPDPWDGLEDQFPAGSIVHGTVEKVAKFGAFIEIAPGITGLLPTSSMNLPREAQPARVYGPGKEVSVQILSIDRRRRRISLSLEGSQVEATRADLKSYLDQQRSSDGSFGALAAAFDRAKRDKDR
jgi:predicted RNA-binding protein with RPS1 domain